MDLTTLISTLTGGDTYREKSGLPEWEDISTYMSAKVSPDVLQMKDLLIAKALSDKHLKAGVID